MKDIAFTFGIITAGNQDIRLMKIVNSIQEMGIPEYEIIIIGSCGIQARKMRVIEFNETSKSRWITRKKNLITQNAKYEDIVFLHDYFLFLPGWYEGWKKFGTDYKACMNKIVNNDGSRFRDWTLFPPHSNPRMPSIPPRQVMVPYDMDVTYLNRFMYFSGGYWVAKKSIMQELPLDENLVWGEGEDVKWSEQFRSKYMFSMNPDSSVKIMKGDKDRAFEECSPETIEYLRNFK